MLGQQRQLTRSDCLAEGQSPAGNVVAATGSRTCDGNMGCGLKDSGAKQIPAAEKFLEGPVPGEKLARYPVFVRLVTKLDAEKIRAQRRDRKGGFLAAKAGVEVARLMP